MFEMAKVLCANKYLHAQNRNPCFICIQRKIGVEIKSCIWSYLHLDF